MTAEAIQNIQRQHGLCDPNEIEGLAKLLSRSLYVYLVLFGISILALAHELNVLSDPIIATIPVFFPALLWVTVFLYAYFRSVRNLLKFYIHKKPNISRALCKATKAVVHLHALALLTGCVSLLSFRDCHDMGCLSLLLYVFGGYGFALVLEIALFVQFRKIRNMRLKHELKEA